jgi:hypothetical protein
VPDAARRKEIAERAYMATAERFWTSDASLTAAALDKGLRYAVLHVLSASGVEQRWDEAAAYQAAWERTETRASVPCAPRDGWRISGRSPRGSAPA